MKKVNFTFILVMLVTVLFAQNRPFPQHYPYASGSILPNNYSATQRDQQVKTFYDSWKAAYFQTACKAGQYYVKFTSGTVASTSEGHGYGMMIAALMAGYDAQAKTIFDGLYSYYKEHPSGITPGLMAWKQNTSCVNTGGDDAATDGDVDIAYALLLADKQWGSTGTINYMQEAKTIIGAIKSGELNGSIIKLGDWYDNTNATYGNSTRPSDFILDHYRAFKQATADVTWDNVVTKAYAIVSTIQTNNSPNTGLLPDFAINCNTTPKPAGSGFLEGTNDGNYAYNACRVPWRIGTDFLISGDAKAKTALDKINTWIKTKTSNNVSSIAPGYTLAGVALASGYDSPAFTGPFGVGAMCNSANQTWVNDIYNYLISYSFSQQGYYENSIAMMCLIVMSGNYWAPIDLNGFTLSVSTSIGGSVTQTPTKTIYTNGESVTLTAVPALGYEFDSWSGDITGTSSTIAVTMNSNKNITATFKTATGQWCPMQTDLLNLGVWHGYKDAKSTLDTSFTLVSGKYTIPWKVARMTKPNAWDTYVEIDAELPCSESTTFKDLTNVKITYKSDKPFIMSLPQPSLAASGESYIVSLPIAATLTTKEFPIAQFQQPSWKTYIMPLALDSITVVALSPDVDPTSAAVSGTIEISELLLCGVECPVYIPSYGQDDPEFYVYPNPAKETIVVSLTNLSDKSFDNKSVDIVITNAIGQVVYEKNLSDGRQIKYNVNINVNDLQSGIYFIRIGRQVQKFVKN